jgi:hypothetical protein
VSTWIRRQSMMTCRQVADLLSDYLAGELPDAQIAAIRKHLEGCAICEDFFESLKNTVRLTKTIDPEEIPAVVVDRLQAFLGPRLGLIHSCVLGTFLIFKSARFPRRKLTAGALPIGCWHMLDCIRHSASSVVVSVMRQSTRLRAF